MRTAYSLFCDHGVPEVGIDRVIEEAKVAKMSLYRHFGSKENLVVAVLERRADVWSRGWLRREVEARSSTASGQLVAAFDVFDGWFHHEHFEGCLFVNSLTESHDASAPIGRCCINQLDAIRFWLCELAGAAGAADATDLAWRWQLLMWGSIGVATAGDVDAARRAREVALVLLIHERISV